MHYCILFHFHAGFNAMVTTKKNGGTYGCYDVPDKPRSGRPVPFVNNALKSLEEANPKPSIPSKELSRSLGEANRQRMQVKHQLAETRIFVNQFAIYHYPDFIKVRFLIASLLETKRGFFSRNIESYVSTSYFNRE